MGLCSASALSYFVIAIEPIVIDFELTIGFDFAESEALIDLVDDSVVGMEFAEAPYAPGDDLMFLVPIGFRVAAGTMMVSDERR